MDRMNFPQASRSTDPESSRAAERDVTESGTRATHAEVVLAMILERPGLTSGELTAATGIDRHAVSRRTADLRSKGLVINGAARQCTVHRSLMMTWWPAEPIPQQSVLFTEE